eukprot:gnl/Chilomastix_cuspidata/4951.p1 GENE.gnl/Chilomastix_cuspidata/4951~~gnl/Chilomastix_cuspidata/4951.p1  ORF type:complete len:258 (+),score=88.05 gnl/Chilomastix_cuspidata/4951:78-851(+)
MCCGPGGEREVEALHSSVRVDTLPKEVHIKTSDALAAEYKLPEEFFARPQFAPSYPPHARTKVLSRITLALPPEVGSFTLGTFKAPVFRYDIVAVAPSGPKAFDHCCLSLRGLNLIALRPPLEFRPHAKAIRTAIARGVCIELQYAPALAAAPARQSFLELLRHLVRVTKGKGLILSSGADDEHALRRPAELDHVLEALGGATRTELTRIHANGPRVLSRMVSLRALKSAALIEPGRGGPAEDPRAWAQDGLGDFVQ